MSPATCNPKVADSQEETQKPNKTMASNLKNNGSSFSSIFLKSQKCFSTADFKLDGERKGLWEM